MKVRIAQRRRQHRGDDCALRRQGSVAVEGLAEELLSQRVDHHVAGSCIEGHHPIGRSSGWDCRQVGDAADVLQHAPALAVGKQHVIQQRNQRRALPAGQHIRRTEVRNHGNAERRGNRRRFARLPGASKAPARIGLCARLMIESLPVAADQVQLHVVPLHRFARRLGVGQPQPPVEPRQLGRRGRGRVHRRQHRPPQCSRKREALVRQQCEFGPRQSTPRRSRRDAHHGHIDSIGRGAAHYARYDHGLRAHAG